MASADEHRPRGEHHEPVMLREVLEALDPKDGEVFVDGTWGAGGYSRALLNSADVDVWAIDRDPDAIRRASEDLTGFGARLHIVHGNFGDAVSLLARHDLTAVDGVTFDLGVSSFQLDDGARGFSFMQDGPLDMRMDTSGDGITAADIVNGFDERELADILKRYGDERRARRIARAIVAERSDAPFETTSRLASVVARAAGGSRSDIHPATRTFLALRIYVNQEIAELRRGLRAATRLLRPGGRIAVVSFHSLEDRVVKNFLRETSGRAPGVSRHRPERPRSRAMFAVDRPRPGRPTDDEIAGNPRSRSARLRVAVRTDAPVDDALLEASTEEES